jgi:hypothetical protein
MIYTTRAQIVDKCLTLDSAEVNDKVAGRRI